MNAANIAPCPHCGSRRVTAIAHEVIFGTWTYVTCNDCSTSGPRTPGDDFDAAIAAWNELARFIALGREAERRELAAHAVQTSLF